MTARWYAITGRESVATDDNAWKHAIRSNIARIRSNANKAALIENGRYDLYGLRIELRILERNLWDIAAAIDRDVDSLFLEIERLQKKCGEK